MPGKIIINENLLAQLIGDPFLKGSVGLEGNSFGIVIAFLQDYLENHYQRLFPQSELPTAITTLIGACQRLAIYEQRLGEVNSPVGLRQFAETIARDLKTLKPGEYILLPGGWHSSTSNHAMIYQFEIIDSQHLLLSVNNAGSGLSKYHHRLSTPNKELYNPHKTYLLPTSCLANPELANGLEILFTPRCHSIITEEPSALNASMSKHCRCCLPFSMVGK